MESITLKIDNEYTAKIDYSLNGSLDLDRVIVKPDIAPTDISYACDVSIPEGDTIASESTILKYFQACKISDIKLVDVFTAAILNRKLHG